MGVVAPGEKKNVYINSIDISTARPVRGLAKKNKLQKNIFSVRHYNSH